MELARRSITVTAASALLSIMLASCSSGSNPSVVFEEVTAREHECPAGTPAAATCLTVVASVVGSGEVGEGRCRVYASARDRNLFVAADSGPLAISPGQDVEWPVTLMAPHDPEFDGWNPVCVPVAEG